MGKLLSCPQQEHDLTGLFPPLPSAGIYTHRSTHTCSLQHLDCRPTCLSFLCSQMYPQLHALCPTASAGLCMHLHSHAQCPLTSACSCTHSHTVPLCTLDTPTFTHPTHVWSVQESALTCPLPSPISYMNLHLHAHMNPILYRNTLN